MPPSRSNRTASPARRPLDGLTYRTVEWDERLSPESIHTGFDTLVLSVVVELIDHQAMLRLFRHTRAPDKLAHLEKYLYAYRPHRWFSDKSLGLTIGFCEDHPCPALPGFANAVVRIGGTSMLRHRGDHAAAWREAITRLASHGVRVIDHQVSSVDLALDFAEWGASRDRSLLCRFDAARPRFKTRAEVLPPESDWGIAVASEDFKGSAYDLSRRLNEQGLHGDYEQSNGESAPTPSDGVLTRVEFTARRPILLACGIETIEDLDSSARRQALVAAFGHCLRICRPSNRAKNDHPKNDPDWDRVLSELRRWSRESLRTVRAFGCGKVTTLLLDKSPNLAHQSREGREPLSLHTPSRHQGARSRGDRMGQPEDIAADSGIWTTGTQAAGNMTGPPRAKGASHGSSGGWDKYAARLALARANDGAPRASLSLDRVGKDRRPAISTGNKPAPNFHTRRLPASLTCDALRLALSDRTMPSPPRGTRTACIPTVQPIWLSGKSCFNTIAIQAALDAVHSAGGGEVTICRPGNSS